MSANASSAEDAMLAAEAVSAAKVRVVGTHPELLSRTYTRFRVLPPAVALLLSLPASQHRLGSLSALSSEKLAVQFIVIMVVLVYLWSSAFHAKGDVRRWVPRLHFITSQSLAVLWGSLLCVAAVVVGRYLFHAEVFRDVEVALFAFQCLLYGCALVLVAALVFEVAYRVSGPGLYIIVGTRSRAIDAYQHLRSHAERRGTIMGFVDTQDASAAHLPAPFLGSLDKLETLLARNPVDMVYFTLPLRSHYATVQTAIWTCERLGVNYCCSPNIFETSARHDHVVLRDAQRAVRGNEDARLTVKRVADLLGACTLLLILAPLMLVIAIAIKANSPGAALFLQSRYGKNRRKFTMYKFRSMVSDAESKQTEVEHVNEADGPIFKARRDPRITPLGKVLRRLSLDELPQLFNVVKGDMSLVGPRPMSIRDVHRFSNAHFMRRFSVTPGMTGLWQVSGRSNLRFDEWIKLDMQYIDHWNLALDFQILLKTVRAVLLCDGAQ